MTLETIAKKVNEKLEKKLTKEEFKIYNKLNKESIENMAKKIEGSILIPLGLRIEV